MNIFYEWRRWIRPIVIAFYFVAVVIAVPILVVEFNLTGVKKNLQAWFIGGLFVILAIPISIWGIVQHMIHYTQPTLQRYIIRILWMVPIYATDAWFALRFKDAAIYLDTIRECYEAYVLYNFMAYILQYLTLESSDIGEDLEKKPPVSHLFPLCFVPAWKNGRQLLMRCKHGVLQYTVVRPATTIVALGTQFGNVYHEGKFQPQSAWLYLTIINSLSQGVAMYCLLMFYRAAKEELRPIKPIPKFLCIKAIVFFLFWQQVLIAGLVALGWIKDSPRLPDFTAHDIATGLQDLIICIEMFLFAIAHYFSFSHKPFVDYAQGYQDWRTSFRAMWDVSDVRDDVVDHVRTVGVTATEVVTRPLRTKPTGTKTEKTPLLKNHPPESATSGDEGINERTIMPPTPPVHIDVEAFYEIHQSERQNLLQNDQSSANVQQNDKPLIDFAAAGTDVNNSHATADGESSNQRVDAATAATVNHSFQDSIDSAHTHETTPPPPGQTSSPHSKQPHLSSQRSKEDSISTHTFESVSDITDTSSQRPATGSMQNYAQFSDTDTVSHTSQHSELYQN